MLHSSDASPPTACGKPADGSSVKPSRAHRTLWKAGPSRARPTATESESRSKQWLETLPDHREPSSCGRGSPSSSDSNVSGRGVWFKAKQESGPRTAQTVSKHRSPNVAKRSVDALLLTIPWPVLKRYRREGKRFFRPRLAFGHLRPSNFVSSHRLVK